MIGQSCGNNSQGKIKEGLRRILPGNDHPKLKLLALLKEFLPVTGLPAEALGQHSSLNA